MPGGHVLGAEGDHQQHMTARHPLFLPPILPTAKQLQGQFIRPLAIIQQDQRRPLRRTQDVQERGQRLQERLDALGTEPDPEAPHQS